MDNEYDVAENLRGLIEDAANNDENTYFAEFEGVRVRNYAECGMLTNNEGLVLTTKGGNKYQLTIVEA
jgi:hypothetical protein